MKNDLRSRLIETFRLNVLKLFVTKERQFLRVLIVLFIISGVFYKHPTIAMWLGFVFAGYSAIANDSIQTIGTFLSSNSHRKWWQLWLFIGLIFIVTVSYSWFTYNGDVSYQRLTSKGFEAATTQFEYLQLAAPLVLLFLTRLRMPVSTTFLLLSTFSANTQGILDMSVKSLSGYVVAFTSAVLLWTVFAQNIRKLTLGEPHPVWTIAQWVISGCLWSVWLMQDAANIAVFLPRSLSPTEFMFFVFYIFLGLGLLFFMRGDKIQEIVDEKTEMKDVRGATLIDLTYTLILFVFMYVSKIPMSTTWVFLGLLAGREVAMTLSNHFQTRELSQTIRLILNDIAKAFTGLVISVLLAIVVNQTIQVELCTWVKSLLP